MRHPERWRNVGLVACIAGIAIAAAPFLLPAATAGDGVRAALFSLGITAVIFGGATALLGHRDVRAKAALARGEDVLARWHVDAATWRAFLAADSHARDGLPWLPNELSVADDVPTDGVEIIVGRDAIEVGGSVHVLPRHGAPEVLEATLVEGRDRPDTIELQLRYPGGGGASGVSRDRPTRDSPFRSRPAPGAKRAAWSTITPADGPAKRIFSTAAATAAMRTISVPVGPVATGPIGSVPPVRSAAPACYRDAGRDVSARSSPCSASSS